METLINEKNEAFRRIKEELTPRINGEIGVSVQEKIECEQERAELSNRIAEIDAELANVQELPPEEEVKVEPILSTVDGLPLAVFAKNEDAAILIQCEAESIAERLNKAHVVVVGGLNSKLHIANELELELRQRITLLENDYETSAEQCRELSEENETLLQEKNQFKLELEQSKLYENNAKAQLEEMAFELEQNRIELNQNREVRAYTEAERTAQQVEARQRFLDSRIKIYNPRNADELNSRERIANLAETGEEITYLAIYEKGTYVEITEDEALNIQAMKNPPVTPKVDGIELFQEDASAEESLSATEQGIEQQDGRNNESPVGEVETFEQRTERRLTTIERRLDKDEPVVYHEVA